MMKDLQAIFGRTYPDAILRWDHANPALPIAIALVE